jgi:DNA-binding transcriptional regulator PaaX
MSNKAITWAFEQDLPTIDKFVLVVLADYADEAHSCYPGQQRIATNTGASVSTVRRALARLERHGLILRERRRRKDGSRTSDRYLLPVDNYRRSI